MISFVKSQIRKFKYKLRKNKKLNFRNSDSSFLHVENLRKYGISIDNINFKQNIITKKIFDQYNNIPHNKLQKIIDKNKDIKSTKSYKQTITKFFNKNDLYEFANQKSLISEVSQYFGFKPHIRYISAWIDFPLNDNEPTWSQLFHRDSDDYYLIKVFFYLNDVNDLNGPFQYLKNTHIESWEEFNSQKLDEYIDKNIENAIGERGTLILCDTNGYHRGLVPRTGYRSLITINYVSDKPKNGFLEEIVE